MSIRVVAAAALVALSACAAGGPGGQIQKETREVREIPDGFHAGIKYVVRTQTIAGPNGTYDRTSVVFRGISRTCILDSPQDCEKTARWLIEDCDEAFNCIV